MFVKNEIKIDRCTVMKQIMAEQYAKVVFAGGILSLTKAEGTVRLKSIPHPSNRFRTEPEGVHIESWWPRSGARPVSLSGSKLAKDATSQRGHSIFGQVLSGRFESVESI